MGNKAAAPCGSNGKAGGVDEAEKKQKRPVRANIMSINDGYDPLFHFSEDKLRADLRAGLHEIRDFLWLGDCASASKRDVLIDKGITHVVNCLGRACEFHPEDVKYHSIEGLDDVDEADIASLLGPALAFIDEARANGSASSSSSSPSVAAGVVDKGVDESDADKNVVVDEEGKEAVGSDWQALQAKRRQRANAPPRVLVHCAAGVSRSATIVAAYLMLNEDRGLDDVLGEMRAIRCIVNPNPSFQRQVVDWVKAEREQRRVASSRI